MSFFVERLSKLFGRDGIAETPNARELAPSPGSTSASFSFSSSLRRIPSVSFRRSRAAAHRASALRSRAPHMPTAASRVASIKRQSKAMPASRNRRSSAPRDAATASAVETHASRTASDCACSANSDEAVEARDENARARFSARFRHSLSRFAFAAATRRLSSRASGNSSRRSTRGSSVNAASVCSARSRSSSIVSALAVPSIFSSASRRDAMANACDSASRFASARKGDLA
mmetsp:Transcript_10876/g.45661  ORF Transcript_10876/g.45661 Transcript_10876/m.45661 type:complete len:232 (+) Transcript_10876:453-1148(+)